MGSAGFGLAGAVKPCIPVRTAMVLKIVRYPEPVLRAKCRAVTEVTPEVR